MTNDKLNLKPYLNCSKEIPCSACSKKGSCLLKAVEMVSKSWGRAVTRGGKYGCPITPENPQGRTYLTVASGSRAEIIMKAYEP